MKRLLANHREGIYTALRVVAGLMFATHGAQKLFGAFGGVPVGAGSFMGLAGVIELAAGVLIALGLLTRPLAFLASGEMAVAFFVVHAPKGPWPIENGGELVLTEAGSKKRAGVWLVSPERLEQDLAHLGPDALELDETSLAAILAQVGEIGARHRVNVCNVFHAGDGNLHPNIPYNAHDRDEAERVHMAMGEIMEACIAAGGSITGEHGVGRLKRGALEDQLGPEVMALTQRIKRALDPQGLMNPGKLVR